MRLTPKSLALLALAALLGVVDLASPGADSAAAELPVLAAVPREAVRRVEISRGLGGKMVLVGSLEQGWRVTQPFEGEADPMLVRALLNLFREPVPMDVRLDRGNLEQYALDDEQAMVVELFTEGEVPVVSVAIGADMPGGTSFVRLSGSEEVYRARVGGRARYDKDFSEWRNRMVLDWEGDTITDLELARGAERLHFQREVAGFEAGRPQPGPWVRVDDPTFTPDPEALDELVKGFATQRAGRLLPADFDGGFAAPLAELTLTRADGERVTMRLGGRSTPEAVYLALEGRPERYQVSGARLAAATQATDLLRDRRIFTLNRADFDTFTLRDSGVSVVLRQQSDAMWEVVEPPNVDADVKLILFAANTFASLRAEGRGQGVRPADVGLDRPAATLTARLRSGDEYTLRLGQSFVDDQGRGWVHVSPAGSEEVYLVRDQVVARMLAGFGRG